MFLLYLMLGAVRVHHHGVVQVGGEAGAEACDIFGAQSRLLLQLGRGHIAAALHTHRVSLTEGDVAGGIFIKQRVIEKKTRLINGAVRNDSLSLSF